MMNEVGVIVQQNRERLSSRLGFILLSAGCAVGLGNVWRFPYVTGQNGGAIFVLVYLFFLAIFGLPIMVMEFSVGRASQRSVATAFNELEPKGTKWHWFRYVAMGGNFILMMFYTTIGGWMLQYLIKIIGGEFEGANTQQVETVFSQMQQEPVGSVFWMVVTTLLGFGICMLGLRKGVEKITKIMMSSLFVIMLVLAVRSFTLPGAMEGLQFYLWPDLNQIQDNWWNIVGAAMGQAFFTLSIGIGSMAIFGSYIGKSRSLMGEACNITFLVTLVALVAGLIIFPACSSFGVDVGSGPKLVFVTLPNIFNSMAGGRIWGALFFLFMTFAALTTIIAVFENIVSFGMDLFHWSRKKSVTINIVVVIVLSLPCALGFSLLNGFQPLGAGTSILDLEDFIVSNNLLPIGSLIFLLFCTRKSGWGWENFIEEANQGKGWKFPKWARFYVTWILPILVIFIFLQGYIQMILA